MIEKLKKHKICQITLGIKKYKSVIKKKKKKHKIVLLASLNFWGISHDEFVLIHNVLKKFYEIKDEI